MTAQAHGPRDPVLTGTGHARTAPTVAGVPVDVACLVPSAPLLLPRLTGDRVPELEPVRSAVAAALRTLVGLDRVVVVAARLPGSLDGFGGRRLPTPTPTWTSTGPGGGSWPHALAAELLAPVSGVPRPSHWCTWGDLDRDDTPLTGDGRTGLLLLADGSRTRGPRAPGVTTRVGRWSTRSSRPPCAPVEARTCRTQPR